MFNKEFIIKFKKNKRAYYSLLIFGFLFIASFFAEIIANDKPLLVRFDGKFYAPIFQEIAETKFGGELLTSADYLDPEVQNLIKKNGWIIFAPIPFSFDTINLAIKDRAPSQPTKSNLLGTDDQGRDVLSRIIYGIRISLIFGLILSFFSLIIGIFLGAVQGYFGGRIDLFLQS